MPIFSSRKRSTSRLKNQSLSQSLSQNRNPNLNLSLNLNPNHVQSLNPNPNQNPSLHLKPRTTPAAVKPGRILRKTVKATDKVKLLMATAKETAEATKALVTDKVKAAAPVLEATKANMAPVAAVVAVLVEEMALEPDRVVVEPIRLKVALAIFLNRHILP